MAFRSPRAGAALLAAVLLIGAAWVRTDVALNHDVAWLLTAAGRMMSGGSYGKDFFEINMPLTIAIYIPAMALARLVKVSLSAATTIWVFVLALQSIALTVRIAAPDGGRRSALWCAWLVIGLVLLPGYDFAQKEHLAVLLFLPFLFAIASDGIDLGGALRLYISFLAAIGFFLKPHFAALPLLLLAAEAYRTRSWKPLRSTEAMTLLCVGVVYAAIVVSCFPDWFICARWTADLYGAYRSHSAAEVLKVSGEPVFIAVSVLQLVAVCAAPAIRRVTVPLLLAVAYSWLAYWLQFKGWRYQFLPAALLLFVSQGAIIQAATATMHSIGRLRKGILLASGVGGGLLAAAGATMAMQDLPRASQLPRSPIGQALAVADKGDTVYAFTTAVVPVFPSVLIDQLNWGSRYPALWPLAGLLWREQQPQGTSDRKLAAAYKDQLIRSVSEDFSRYRPRIVLIDRRAGQFGIPPGYDVLGFFTGDPRFADQWKSYQEIGSSSEYIVFARVDDELPGN